MMSTTHKIGAVCGTDAVPPVWRYGEGYRAGAAYVDKKFGTKTQVNIVYHNDVGFDKTFTDPVWGGDVANKLIADGADVIFGCGGDTGNGAVKAAAQRGVYAIGVDTDQYFTLPEAVAWLLSSALKPETEPVAHLIRLAKDGAFPTDGFFYGPPGYAPYHDLAGKVPASVDAEMKAILDGLGNGAIKTGVPLMKP
jgi:basic membrane protein A